uniref:Ig-like domain-containing protein n=1 Tax=Electrophorus electricus TaxID=8005 RepID=A0A4W4E3Y2_ELEEL
SHHFLVGRINDNTCAMIKIHYILKLTIQQFTNELCINLSFCLPLLIADSQRYSKEATFYNGFDKKHYIVQTEDSSCALSIVKKEQSDTATYYCTVAFMNIITFGDGTVLVIKDSEDQDRECTVLTEICAGGHSVYWFRHGSEESQPGIIYTNGHSKGQCQKSSAADSPTESCVYELTKRNLSLSDAGTYYCAVALCGQILFGNGTTRFFNGKDCNVMTSEKISHCYEFYFILLLLQVDNKDSLNYAALSFSHKPASSKKSRAKPIKDKSVYAQVGR